MCRYFKTLTICLSVKSCRLRLILAGPTVSTRVCSFFDLLKQRTVLCCTWLSLKAALTVRFYLIKIDQDVVDCMMEEVRLYFLQCTFTRSSFSLTGGDQGLLNMFFHDWATKDISKRLPFTYNVVSQTFYSYLPAFKQ